jgi:hypothetical protein
MPRELLAFAVIEVAVLLLYQVFCAVAILEAMI